MCKREMTLGEEIIGLSTRGIDTPTVERMYRKYIEMAADKESKEAMRAYCINDELAIKEFVNAIFGVPAKSDLKNAEVGDKTTIKLNGFGEFTATVHKVTDDRVMLIFDDYVTKRPMNESDTNKGGFEESDLNKWLHTEFVKALPYSIRGRLTNVTIPTVKLLKRLEKRKSRLSEMPLQKRKLKRIRQKKAKLYLLEMVRLFATMYYPDDISSQKLTGLRKLRMT